MKKITDIVNSKKKRLYNIFDVYGIQHSEIFIVEGHTTMSKMRMYESNGVKIITSFDIDSPVHGYTELYMVIYVNYPVFTPKTAMRYVTTIMKSVYHNSYKDLNKIRLYDKVLNPDEIKNGKKHNKTIIISRLNYK